jgi:hypothetical protein
MVMCGFTTARRSSAVSISKDFLNYEKEKEQGLHLLG